MRRGKEMSPLGPAHPTVGSRWGRAEPPEPCEHDREHGSTQCPGGGLVARPGELGPGARGSGQLGDPRGGGQQAGPGRLQGTTGPGGPGTLVRLFVLIP